MSCRDGNRLLHAIATQKLYVFNLKMSNTTPVERYLTHWKKKLTVSPVRLQDSFAAPNKYTHVYSSHVHGAGGPPYCFSISPIGTSYWTGTGIQRDSQCRAIKY